MTRSASRPEGMLVVDKPLGASSFDVIRRLRRILGTRSLGHTGTLDPAATGVLCVCAGWSLKLMRFFDDDRKSYRATVRLGQVTETDDREGEVVEEHPVTTTRDELERALARFVGEIEQVPPAFSAVKVAGERAYAKARRGEDVELRARTVRIDRVQIVAYEPPVAVVDVDCGKGTYIRSVARDLGRALGCGGHLSALRRTRSGVASESDALDLDTIEARVRDGDAEGGGGWEALPWLSPWRLLEHLPAASLAEEEALAIRQGKRVTVPAPPVATEGRGGDVLMRLEQASHPGELLAVARVAERRGGSAVLQPVKVRPPGAAAGGD